MKSLFHNFSCLLWFDSGDVFLFLWYIYCLLRPFRQKNIKALTNGIYTPFKHEINISFFHVCKSLTVARYIYCFKLVHTLLRHFIQKKYQPSDKQ